MILVHILPGSSADHDKALILCHEYKSLRMNMKQILNIANKLQNRNDAVNKQRL